MHVQNVTAAVTVQNATGQAKSGIRQNVSNNQQIARFGPVRSARPHAGRIG